MDNLAASTRSSYFKRSHPVALKTVFYSRGTKALLHSATFIITWYYCFPLILLLTSCGLSSSKGGLKYTRGGPAPLGLLTLQREVGSICYKIHGCKSSIETACSAKHSCLCFSFVFHITKGKILFRLLMHSNYSVKYYIIGLLILN